MRTEGPILFYDGECGLCDRSVRWLLDRDTRQVLRFAPLQGETYAAIAVVDKPNALGTVVLHDEMGLHVRSNAVLHSLKHIGGFWGVCGTVGLVVPRVLRDSVYNFVAQRRLAWFGGKDACRIPSRSDRERLLP